MIFQTKSYSELIKLPTFEERFRYLKLSGHVGRSTFNEDRWVNQEFYHSYEWKKFRRHIIIRDNGCDLGIEGREIFDRILIHHINPITLDDLINRRSVVLDPDNVISTAFLTHQAIHYSDESILTLDPVVRRPNDTCPWK